MAAELPDTGSDEAGLLERLGANLLPEAPVEDEAIEASQPEDEELPPDSEEEAAPAEEDSSLFEYTADDGQTYKVPAQLKNELMHKADHDRKSQELSMLARSAQSTLQQQAVIAKFQTETTTEQRRLDQINSELSRLKGADWTQYDTDTLMKARIHMDNLRDEASELNKTVESKRKSVLDEFSRIQAEASRHGYEYIARHVRDWTPGSKTEEDVAKYASGFGIAPEVLGNIARIYPGFAVLAHKAAQFDKIKVGPAVQKVQKAPPVVKPGGTSSNTVQAKQVQDQRSRLKKSGDYRDAAALMSKFVR